jgi:hypothetical protein
MGDGDDYADEGSVSRRVDFMNEERRIPSREDGWWTNEEIENSPEWKEAVNEPPPPVFINKHGMDQGLQHWAEVNGIWGAMWTGTAPRAHILKCDLPREHVTLLVKALRDQKSPPAPASSSTAAEIEAVMKTIPEQKSPVFGWSGPKFWVTYSLTPLCGYWLLTMTRELPNGWQFGISYPVREWGKERDDGHLRAETLKKVVQQMLPFMDGSYPDWCVRHGSGKGKPYQTPEEARAAAEQVLRDAESQEREIAARQKA